MKRIFIAGILFASLSAFGQAEPKRIQSKITKAVVYPSGAMVTRSAQANVQGGEVTLVLGPIEQGINAQTIRVSGKGAGSIRMFYETTNYLENTESKNEVKALEDRRKALQMAIEDRNVQLQTLHDEENLLVKNQTLTGTNGLDMDAVLEMSNLYRTRLAAIRQEKLKISRQTLADQEEINRLNAQINQFYGASQTSVREIHVVVDAKSAGSLSLEASYFVYSAGWTPQHELYAGNGDEVDLVTKARIIQNTGSDWNNATIILSTAQASLSGNLPPFSPQVLRNQVVYQEAVVAAGGRRSKALNAPESVSQGRDLAMDKEEDLSFTPAVQSEALTRVDFNLPGTQTVPSGIKGISVQIKDQKLKAKYRHVAYPRADPTAFLTARVYGWDPAGLLPGETSLYVDEGYVGSTRINPAAMGDTLVLSLGRDPGVGLKYTLLPQQEENSFLGKNVKKKRTYKIEIKNNKKASVTLTLTEQIPVSSQKEIEVEVKNLSGGVLEPKQGKVNWNLTLQPGETKTLMVEYEVSHPKDWNVPF